MSAALLVALAALGQNPGWPAPADTPPEALADPARMPGDPDYAPRPDPVVGCAGQLELYGFTPACTPAIAAGERERGSGVAADRAWSLTRGTARVTIAVLDTGADWGDRELAGKWRLDEGELPAPAVGVGPTKHDRNGDGAFTPLDYTSATGTAAPSVDRVVDAVLRARPDRGDVDGNGLIDPQDLRVVFGDGVDDDGDGLVDETSGWDFVGDDGDAGEVAGPAAGHGRALMRAAAAETNNGLAGAGACPRCTVLPFRVATPDGARGELYADAIVAAARAGARVILLGTPPDYATSAIDAAVREAELRGALVIGAAGDLRGVSRSPALARSGALVVSALAHDARDRTRATTALAPGPIAGLALERGVSAPAASDGLAAALVAGVAGLVLSAAEGAASAPPLDPPLAPGELAQLLIGTTADGTWSLARGAGRVSARAAVEAVLARAIPPVIELVAPQPGSIVDPTPGLPVLVEGRVSSPRGQAVEWTLDSAVGVGASADAFGALSTGGSGEVVSAQLPIVGLFRDPTAPPGPPLAYAITARLTATARLGATVARAQVQRVLWAHHDLLTIPGFPRLVGGPVAAAPRALDVDGDGTEDVLAATTDGALVWLDANGEVRDGWPFLAPPRAPRLRDAPAARAAFASNPAIAVLAPGEAPSIVALTEAGALYALDRGGQARGGFPVQLEVRSGRFHGPAVQDLDGDGVAEIVVATSDGLIDVIDARGARRAGFPVRGEGPLSAPAIAARAGIVVVRSGEREVWSLDGVRTSAQRIGPDPTQVGRRDHPPGPVLGRGASIYTGPLGRGPLLDQDSAGLLTPEAYGARATVPRGAGMLALRAGELAVADLDGDGTPDVLGGAQSELGEPVIAAWSGASGAGLQGFPVEARLAAPVHLGVADLDDDGRPEAMFADDHQRLRAVSADGLSPRAWPKLLPSPLAGVVVARLLAGTRWAVVAVTAEGTLHAWRTEGSAERAPLWDGPRHDRAATADLEAPVARAAPATSDSSCQAARVGGGEAAVFVALAALALRRWRRRS